MRSTDRDVFVDSKGIRIRALVREGDGPPVVLLHGLTANARYWDGLVNAGLDRRSTIALDLRGRGLSDQPTDSYDLAAHAQDVLAVLDELGHERAVLCGHSYGGLLGVYMAALHPARVAGLVVIDIAGPSIQNTQVLELIAPSLKRLGSVWPSADAFISAMRATPALAGAWDAAVEGYFRADIRPLADGRVQVRTPGDVIAQVIHQGQAEDWQAHLEAVAAPVLYLHSRGAFGPPGTVPIVLDDQAKATAQTLRDCRYEIVPGNHMTMLFGDGAIAVSAALDDFLDQLT